MQDPGGWGDWVILDSGVHCNQDSEDVGHPGLPVSMDRAGASAPSHHCDQDCGTCLGSVLALVMVSAVRCLSSFSMMVLDGWVSSGGRDRAVSACSR